MSNAMRRVANYLGLMDDPEFDTPQTSNTTTPAVAPTGDVRIKTREARPVAAVRQSTVVEVAPQLDLPAMERFRMSRSRHAMHPRENHHEHR